jgi:hypothetical protein
MLVAKATPFEKSHQNQHSIRDKVVPAALTRNLTSEWTLQEQRVLPHFMISLCLHRRACCACWLPLALSTVAVFIFYFSSASLHQLGNDIKLTPWLVDLCT